MVGYSVILPHSCAARSTAALVRSLQSVLGESATPYEIVVVTVTSAQHEANELRGMLAGSEHVSLWRLVAAKGVDAAALAALAVCRYSAVITIDPAGGYSALDVPRLLERLSRHDMVIARRRLSGPIRWWDRTRRLLSLLPGPAHDRGCLFWAAHREALPLNNVPRGAARALPAIVARRGYRVGELYIGPPARDAVTAPRTRQHLFDVLAAWWLAGREHRAHCEPLRDAAERLLRIDPPHTSPTGSVSHHRASTSRAEQP